MQTFILALHVLACLILIVIVLLQSGKEGMGVIFGGGSGTVFGSSGAGGLLTKLT
ncbi:MAG: preprotein translocase subunit SecG, partial [Thermodesulfobacteriota bacterium]|nr:preprotein translocase subunit SecG [Thermodesulfobacteriota bacterium]